MSRGSTLVVLALLTSIALSGCRQPSDAVMENLSYPAAPPVTDAETPAEIATQTPVEPEVPADTAADTSSTAATPPATPVEVPAVEPPPVPVVVEPAAPATSTPAQAPATPEPTPAAPTSDDANRPHPPREPGAHRGGNGRPGRGGDMFERFEETLLECGDVSGQRVLDIGCGSGLFSVSLAQRGATVVGLDFAPHMLELARQRAASQGVAECCTFVEADFMTYPLREPFDITLAIGVFDYVARPEPMLARMRTATRGKAIATFPMRWTYRMPIRKLRLALRGCPVFFYSRAEAFQLWVPMFDRVRLVRLGKIYFVVGEIDPPATREGSAS